MRVLKVSKSFKKEFKRQIRFAIVAAVGFTIAFAWRNAVFEAFRNYIARIMDLAPEHYTTEVYTALAITFIGVLAIFLSSKILKERK